MRKVTRLVLAFAFVLAASFSQRAQAFGEVCVDDCSECPAYCYYWYCEILTTGCDETNGMACHCGF